MGILLEDKRLFLLALLIGLIQLVAWLIILFPLGLKDELIVLFNLGIEALVDDFVLNHIILFFILMIFNSFIANFLQSIMVHIIYSKFKGSEPSWRNAYQAASSRIGVLLKWSCFQSSVMLLIMLINEWLEENKLGTLKIFTSLTEISWDLITQLMVPVIALETHTSTEENINTSWQLFKETWGGNRLQG